jgi:ClpP class serine protease
MPTREKIAAEINQQKAAGQDAVRRKYLAALHKKTGRDTVVYFSSYNIQRPFPVPAAALSVSQDDIQGFMASLHGLKGKQLDLVLHSPGGSVEAADQIVQYLRAKYEHIRAIVPQNAMSAATMLACAADEIVMGKHSAIGPIDPQMMLGTLAGPTPVPAHTILQDFERAKAEVASNPVLANLWAPEVCRAASRLPQPLRASYSPFRRKGRIMARAVHVQRAGSTESHANSPVARKLF